MSDSQENQPIAPPAYFASLTIENAKCFKDEQTIDLSDGHGKPALWTVILGDNNTGKTTLLRCLAYLDPKKIEPDQENKKKQVVHWRPRLMDIRTRRFSYEKSNYININSDIFLKKNNTFNSINWFVKKTGACAWESSFLKSGEMNSLVIYGYGINRRAGKAYLSGEDNQDYTETLFDDSTALTNIEEWLLQLYLAKKLGKNNTKNATKILDKIKPILTGGILPDVQDFDVDTTDDFKGFVKFKTNYGWVKLKDLGYGYRSTTTLVLDLVKKLFERYSDSVNPLHQPAIVLIDEIDLHLHPQWQRNIIKYLSELFPHTQFIVTAHSPLIVQSADAVNLVLLEKQDDHVLITQRPEIKTFKGWTVEEILTELMGLDNRILSDDYLKLIHDFDNGLDNDNYSQAKTAYDELVKILHPNSHQPKLLRLQMSSLAPDEL